MQTITPALELEEVTASDRDDDRLLDARQVAAKLGVSERFIRDHTTRRSPRIPGVKLGKLLRYRAADVAVFMAELNTQPSSRRS
jgi:predicted DNA-binding transcriptional regulator AlpA